jgi:hypothetical protein
VVKDHPMGGLQLLLQLLQLLLPCTHLEATLEIDWKRQEQEQGSVVAVWRRERGWGVVPYSVRACTALFS